MAKKPKVKASNNSRTSRKRKEGQLDDRVLRLINVIKNDSDISFKHIAYTQLVNLQISDKEITRLLKKK